MLTLKAIVRSLEVCIIFSSIVSTEICGWASGDILAKGLASAELKNNAPVNANNTKKITSDPILFFGSTILSSPLVRLSISRLCALKGFQSSFFD
jgi:hypothetical protein